MQHSRRQKCRNEIDGLQKGRIYNNNGAVAPAPGRMIEQVLFQLCNVDNDSQHDAISHGRPLQKVEEAESVGDAGGPAGPRPVGSCCYGSPPDSSRSSCLHYYAVKDC